MIDIEACYVPSDRSSPYTSRGVGSIKRSEVKAVLEASRSAAVVLHFTSRPRQFIRIGRVNRLAATSLGHSCFADRSQLLAPITQCGLVQPFLTQQGAEFVTSGALPGCTTNAELVAGRKGRTTDPWSYLRRNDIHGRCGTRGVDGLGTRSPESGFVSLTSRRIRLHLY